MPFRALEVQREVIGRVEVVPQVFGVVSARLLPIAMAVAIVLSTYEPSSAVSLKVAR